MPTDSNPSTLVIFTYGDNTAATNNRLNNINNPPKNENPRLFFENVFTKSLGTFFQYTNKITPVDKTAKRQEKKLILKTVQNKYKHKFKVTKGSNINSITIIITNLNQYIYGKIFAMNKGIIWGTVLFSLGISKVVHYILSKSNSINLFSPETIQNIPTLNIKLAQIKSLDIIEFFVFIGVTMILFGLNYFVTNSKRHLNSICSLTYFFVSVGFLLQVMFVGFSSTVVLLTFGLFHLFFWTTAFIVKNPNKLVFNKEKFANGLLLSLLIIQIVQKINYSLVVPLTLICIIPAIYISVKHKALSSPFHIILGLFILKPGDINWIYFLLALTTVIVLITSHFDTLKTQQSNVIYQLYPYLFIILVAFNPLYFYTNLDSVEEGFWLGWLQRLLNGQVLYKDVYVYHPPLFIWLLKYFVLAFGISVVKVKLFFHLLQVLSYIFYYLLIKKVVKNSSGRIICLLMIMSISDNLLKNNVEIRLALGLLAFVPLATYLSNKRKLWLIISGVVTALSLISSIEVGIVTLVSIIGYFLIAKKLQSITELFTYFAGIFIVILPVSVILLAQGALLPMIEQISFYAKSFSDGYFSLPSPRIALNPILDWKIVYGYIGTMEMWWHLTMITIATSFIYGLSKAISNQKEMSISSHLLLALSIAGLLMFRSTLGRSDWYHLLFPLMITIILWAILIEEHFKKPTVYYFIALVIFAFGINAEVFNKSFVNTQLEKFQSYGRIPGTSKSYQTKRYGIATDNSIDTVNMDSLINYLKTTPNDTKVFAFPWSPEIYFLAQKQNSTKSDTPYAFFTQNYQEQTIEQLKNNQDSLIVYRKDFSFGGMGADKLVLLHDYIKTNFTNIKTFNEFAVMRHN